MPLQPDFKTQLVEALRSGKYKKCRSRLRTKSMPDGEITFCTLGVACDLVEPDKWHDDPMYGDRGELLGYASYHKDGMECGCGALPVYIQQQLGMTNDEHREIVALNDLKDWTFEEIANHIERTM